MNFIGKAFKMSDEQGDLGAGFSMDVNSANALGAFRFISE